MRKLQSILMAAVLLVMLAAGFSLPAMAEGSADLVTAGDFETASAWTLGTGLAITEEGGKSGNGLVLDVEAAGAEIARQEIIGLEAGKTYTLTFDYKLVTTPTAATDVTSEFGLRYILREGTDGSVVGDLMKVLGGEAGDWTAVTANFTVAALPTETPTLQFYMFRCSAGKAYVDNVSITEKVYAEAKTGNLVTSGDLEADTAATDWLVHNMKEEEHVVSHTYGAEGAETTTNVLKLTTTDAASVPFVYQSITGLKPNTTYAVVCDVMMDATDELESVGSESGVRIRVDKKQRLGDPLFYPVYSTATLLTDAWLKFGSSAFTTPADYTTEDVAVLSFHLNNVTGTAYIDNITMYEIEAKPETVINTNGDFELAGNSGTIGYAAGNLGFNPASGPSNKIYMIDNTDPYSGNYCLKFDTALNASLNSATGSIAQRVGVICDAPLEAEKTYKISYAIKVSTWNQSAVLRLDDSKGNIGCTFNNGDLFLPTTNEWYVVTTYLQPTISATGRFYIGSYRAHNGSALWLDDFYIEEIPAGTVDFVRTDKTCRGLYIVSKPKAGGTVKAFATVADGTAGGKLVVAVYGEKDGETMLQSVSVSDTTATGLLTEGDTSATGDNPAAYLLSEEITVPEGGTIKAFIWKADGITPLGEYTAEEIQSAS